MADRAISELTPVTGVNADDSFVLQQNNRAMRLTGQVLLNWLAAALDGHGGINNIAKTGTQGITDTYTITFADQSTATFTVTNGKGVVSIAKTGTAGLVDTYTITYNDQTTSTFTVNNGKGIASIEKTNTTGLIDTYTITYNDQTTTTFTVKNGNGIASIEKTGTSGLVDTYTITMTNGTTSEFTVTNGEKGDKGDNTYTYIMYSANSPTADTDIHPTPDNWMGIYCGPAATAPTSYTAYQWFRIKGEKGDRGDDVSITTATVRYAVSENGTEIPTEWSETIPAIPQGYYLWTRRQIVYSTGTNTTEYSITRNGIDGLGSVSSVNNLSPDSHGNVELPIDTAPVLNSGNLITSGAVATVKNTAELNLALPYSPTGTYVVGQPCIHNGRYYECISPIEIGEEWTPEHWDAPQIGDKLKQQAENLSDEVQRLSEIMSIVSTSDGKAPKAITSGQFVIWNGMLYTASTNIASGATLSTSNLTAVSSDGFNALKGLFGVVHPATELSSVSDITSLLNQSLNNRYSTFIATATLYETLTGISKRAVVTAFKSASDSEYIEYISVDHDGDARSGYYNITNSNDKSAYLSSIHKDSVTGTTSSGGNISKTMGNKVRILSAWTSTGGCVVLPYPQAGADGDGQYTWWFHILNDNSSSSVAANQNVTVYFTYIRA